MCDGYRPRCDGYWPCCDGHGYLSDLFSLSWATTTSGEDRDRTSLLIPLGSWRDVPQTFPRGENGDPISVKGIQILDVDLVKCENQYGTTKKKKKKLEVDSHDV